MEQYDMFGGISEPPEPKPKTQKRFYTMQEKHGTLEGKTCKTCGHRKTLRYAKQYHKCEIWRLSHSAATDIRLKDMACKKWIPRGEE
jgi:hypothetical protein